MKDELKKLDTEEDEVEDESNEENIEFSLGFLDKCVQVLL